MSKYKNTRTICPTCQGMKGRYASACRSCYKVDGAKNPRWIGGRRQRRDGYWLLYVPGHPNACKNYMLEHRIVMERHLGRHLDPSEVVHHKNEDPSDNRLENLELTTQSEHSTHHHKGVAKPKRWKPRVSKDDLTRLYVTDRLSIQEVADKIGMSYGAARRHFEEFGVPFRPKGAKPRGRRSGACKAELR